MEEYINKIMNKIKGPPVVYNAPAEKPAIVPDFFSKENYIKNIRPDVREGINALALRESTNGKYRINKDDQGPGVHSYGILQMGQPAVDEFYRERKKYGYSGEPMKASNLVGAESDDKQRYMQGIRIQNYMDRKKVDITEAIRKIQNPNDPNYGTSTLNVARGIDKTYK